MSDPDPFPTVHKIAKQIRAKWPGYELAAQGTINAEGALRQALTSEPGSRRLGSDASLVLCGSFARREMLDGSDFDWSLLIDGVVDNSHAEQARSIATALKDNKLPSPGSSGTFGNLVFSHELVHRIGGGADSNANLTRRMLMLLESRPFSLSNADSCGSVWDNVLKNILQRYFEIDVHFSPVGQRKLPRFLLNDLTRYWRTICVDYAAKHHEQDGNKWAIRNAKLRFSRKLLYASGLAFCLSCQINPPKVFHTDLFGKRPDESADPYIERAMAFARTPALEYLAAFMSNFVTDEQRRRKIAKRVFGAYNAWLELLGAPMKRKELESLTHADAEKSELFKTVREKGAEFAKGLELLFFNRDRDDEQDSISKLSLEYIGF